MAGGGLFRHYRERAEWRCPCRQRGSDLSVGTGADIWQEGYTLRQNAALLLHWAKSTEPNSEELAADTFVDHGSLVRGWLKSAREVVSSEQARWNKEVQIGGPGVEVEIDEICFRARWVSDGEDGSCREWQRYIAAFERRSGKLVLMQLPTRRVKGAGQGGGGSLTSEELHSFIMRDGGVPLLLPGTIVHTDGAMAYRDLDWCSSPDVAKPPTAEMIQEALGQKPTAWRLETCREVLEREAAQRRDSRGRKEEWSKKYEPLRLVHTSVSHSKSNGVVQRQFVAMRRVRVHPDDVAAVSERDPLMRDGAGWLGEGVCWRKGGTQTVDGYWKTLRRRAGHRGTTTSLAAAVQNLVFVHQWSHAAGPGADMVAHLGKTLEQYRRHREEDMAAARAATEPRSAGEPAAAAVKAAEATPAVERGQHHLQRQATLEASAMQKSKKVQKAASSFSSNCKRRAEFAAAPLVPAFGGARRLRQRDVGSETEGAACTRRRPPAQDFFASRNWRLVAQAEVDQAEEQGAEAVERVVEKWRCRSAAAGKGE